MIPATAPTGGDPANNQDIKQGNDCLTKHIPAMRNRIRVAAAVAKILPAD